MLLTPVIQTSLFSRDTYITPPGREKLMHRLLLRSRIYYIARFIAVMFRHLPEARAGAFDHERWSRAAYEVFCIIEECGGRFDIRGLDYLRVTNEPVVIVANHMSTLETIVPPAFIYPYKRPTYVVKEQLFHLPLFGIYLNHCIGVSRKNPAEDFRHVMTRGAEKIQEGNSVIVFPQATRSPTFHPEKFNSLGIKLAKHCGVPVVPLALKTDFWGTGKFLKDFGPLYPARTIYFEFGPPIDIHGSGKEEHQHVIEFIRSRLQYWGVRVEEGKHEE